MADGGKGGREGKVTERGEEEGRGRVVDRRRGRNRGVAEKGREERTV